MIGKTCIATFFVFIYLFFTSLYNEILDRRPIDIPNFRSEGNVLGRIDPAKSYHSIENERVREYLDLVTGEQVSTDACPICCENLNDSNEVIKPKVCMHQHHFHCLATYLKGLSFANQMTCPICRKQFIT